MKILLSVFACAPGAGSEGGCGWKYALRLSEAHEVWVITDISRRDQIEAEPLHHRPGLKFIYYRPRCLSSVRVNSRTALLVYEAWQMGAWRVARELDQLHDFDFIWHLTYGSFRHPSRYWRVGKPFVFGPLAGGETSPWALRRELRLRDQMKEAVRDVSNRLMLARPALRATYKHSALTIARTEETRDALPAAVRPACPLQENIGAYSFRGVDVRSRQVDGPLRALFVGRLLWWKGVDLALRAVAANRESGGNTELTVIGEGPAQRWLQAMATELALADRVQFVGRMTQELLFQRFRDFDVLLFPSLHDSGGNVVLEALSHALPVVCLDLGGPPTFVDQTCGVVVRARQSSPGEVISALAAALFRMEQDRDLYHSLSAGALRRAEELTWDKQIDRCLDLVRTRVFDLKKGGNA